MNDGCEPIEVPASPALLGTPHHLLLNELCRSPRTLLSAVVKLARQAIDLDTGTFKSSTAPVILYVVRFCCRIDNYVSMMLDYDAGTHACISGKPVRQLELGTGVRNQLEVAQTELHSLLWGELRHMLQVHCAHRRIHARATSYTHGLSTSLPIASSTTVCILDHSPHQEHLITKPALTAALPVFISAYDQHATFCIL